MTDRFSKCGASCSRCPAYSESIRSYEDQQRCSDGEIVDMTRVAVNQRLVGFPDDLLLPAEETAALPALHRLLGRVGSAEGISYAEQAILQKRRRSLVKLLWAWGLHGEPDEVGGHALILDSETYLAQKIDSDYSKLEGYFETLAQYGIH